MGGSVRTQRSQRLNPGTIVCVTHCFLLDIARAYIVRTAVCKVFGRALDIAYIACWTDAVRVY